MEVCKEAKKVLLANSSEHLIEFCRESIWARSFIMLHMENCIPHLRFGERAN